MKLNFKHLVITALVIPASTVAELVTIDGSTAAEWVTSGSDQDFDVVLVATPANEVSIIYDDMNGDVFDATDRDNIGGRTDGPFGLGVDNNKIQNGNPGVTSKPSEIGYYGNSAICGLDKVLGDNCADELAVTLTREGYKLYGGSFGVSFFYGSEEAGEELAVELYRDGVLQHEDTYGPADTGQYSITNAGKWNSDLPDVVWDEIRFIGYAAEVNDASDFLVEFVSGYERPEAGGDSATGSGERIASTRGNWFMYNQYIGPSEQCFDLQAGNPNDGDNIVGKYCVDKLADNKCIVTYDINDTITIGDFDYDIEVLDEHLGISDTQSFTGKPARDDNQNFGEEFECVSPLYVFAHFSLNYV